MYRIKVEKVWQKEDSSYPSYEEIYTQVVDYLDLVKVINAVNKEKK